MSATTDDTSMGSWSYIWACIFTVWIAFFAFLFSRALPQYIELFRGFGAELPALTTLVVQNVEGVRVLLAVMSLVQLSLCVYLLTVKTRKARRIATWSAVLNIALHIGLVGAMYLPIFKLGTVV